MSTPEARAKNNELKRRLRRKNAQKIGEYLSTHPCVDCGESDILVLQFDHVRGTKSFMISDGLNSNGLARVMKEIEKCDVRCANCHIRKTTLERDYVPHKMRKAQ
jgi:5-methylcytosine-specific restriction endonuclease McrA